MKIEEDNNRAWRGILKSRNESKNALSVEKKRRIYWICCEGIVLASTDMQVFLFKKEENVADYEEEETL